VTSGNGKSDLHKQNVSVPTYAFSVNRSVYLLKGYSRRYEGNLIALHHLNRVRGLEDFRQTTREGYEL
jgi:hypothetical protein